MPLFMVNNAFTERIMALFTKSDSWHAKSESFQNFKTALVLLLSSLILANIIVF